MLFSTRVLEFWVMETTNIYDFLHFLSLIKIRPNMDFGGNLAFAHICHNTFFSFFLSKRMEKGSQTKIKLQNKRHTMAFIHLFVSFSFFKLRFNEVSFNLASIMILCILFFRVMCSYLFRIIIVHGVHHWNYLGFNVYFFNDIHVDLSMDVFSYEAKTSLNISAITLEHNSTIFFLNKLFSFFFVFAFTKGILFPLAYGWSWKYQLHVNIAHLD
jgi:hypothetical protein